MDTCTKPEQNDDILQNIRKNKISVCVCWGGVMKATLHSFQLTLMCVTDIPAHARVCPEQGFLPSITALCIPYWRSWFPFEFPA